MPIVPVNIQNRNPQNKGQGNRRNVASITTVIIHHTGGNSIDDAIDALQAEGHAYHYFVDKDNSVKQYVPVEFSAQHAGNMNGISIGIALIGKDDTEVQTRPQQVAAAVSFVNQLIADYNIQKSRVYGHGELPAADKQATEGTTVAKAVRGSVTPQPLPTNAGQPGTGGTNTHGPSRRSDDEAGGGTPVYGYAKGNGLSPYIGSTDSLHPKIQFELSRRRVSEATATTHMPFVKLTSLSNVLADNLDGEPTAYCPSIGVHGKRTVTYDDIYHPQSNRSIVGYAIAKPNAGETAHRQVPLYVSNTNTEAYQFTDAPNIPMPGITGITAERSTAGPMGVRGGLLKADIKLVAYSVGQLDALMRYFLRPATRVVLEMGRRSSNPAEQPITPFNWERSIADIRNDGIDSLVTLQAVEGDTQPQQRFIEKYTYDNFGNYEIFVMYVVTNKIKYTKNNIYEISLTLHSVQQFEVPLKTTGASSICASSVADKCKPPDISAYFENTGAGVGITFDNVLKKAITDGDKDFGEGNEFSNYSKHVVKLIDSDEEDGTLPGYLVSWKFFLEIILHNERLGIMSAITNENLAFKNFVKKSLPPLTNDEYTVTGTSLVSNEVGYHESLRSTNPGVMVLLNSAPSTATAYDDELTRIASRIGDRGFFSKKTILELNSGNLTVETLKKDTVDTALDEAKREENVGEFKKLPDASLPVASLLRGVMLNSNAIKEAFTSTDTVTNALSKLLVSMNNTTEGFWNLQLYSVDGANPGVHVIDAGLSKPVDRDLMPSSIDTVVPNILAPVLFTPDTPDGTPTDVWTLYENDFQTPNGDPKFLYMFNRKLSVRDGEAIGGELLDINVELALPQVIAIQAIAGVGGVAQRGTLEAINIKELRDITLYPNLYASCKDGQQNEICPDQDFKQCEEDYSAFSVREVLTEEEISEFVKDYGADRDTAKRKLRDTLADRTRNGNTFGRVRANELVENLEKQLSNRFQQQNSGFLTLLRNYGVTFGRALKYIEYNKLEMLKRIDDTRDAPDRNGVHPFNSSNLTKTVVDLTMPGIGGIQLFQAFAVDRIPSILNSGYYVVTKVVHEFTTNNGWITKIQGRFRAKPRRPATNDTDPCAGFGGRGSAGSF